MKHQLLNIIKLLGLTLGIALSIFLTTFVAFADWTQPPSTPPTCPAGEPGCETPVHVGVGGQAKEGPFGVGGVFQSLSATYLATDSGNVGIGTSSPGAKLDVAGSMLVNRDSVAYYRNVAHTSRSVSSVTGTLKITLPKNWSNTMMKMSIEGYEYSGSNRGRSWTVTVGGYNYASSTQWINYFAQIDGAARFNSVRLAHDGTNNVILLGTTSSSWSYPKVVVTDFMAGHSSITGWDEGWSIDWITDETGIQNVRTPVIDFFRNTDGNVGIGTTNPQAKLDVRNDAKFYDSSGNLVLIIE